MYRAVHVRRRTRHQRAGRRPPTDLARRVRKNTTRLHSALMMAVFVAATASGLSGTAAYADPGAAAPMAADSIVAVVNNIRAWLVGILVAVATLFLTVGGLRLMWANGDPGEAEKGKAALRSAVVGYGLALLAPLIVTIVAGWVK